MMNGLMNRKLLEGAVMPFTTGLKLAPPSVDFLRDKRVFSAYRIFVFVRSMAT